MNDGRHGSCMIPSLYEQPFICMQIVLVIEGLGQIRSRWRPQGRCAPMRARCAHWPWLSWNIVCVYDNVVVLVLTQRYCCSRCDMGFTRHLVVGAQKVWMADDHVLSCLAAVFCWREKKITLVLITTLLEKQTFVPVGNPHLYRGSNRYKPSGINEGGTFVPAYRVKYPV